MNSLFKERYVYLFCFYIVKLISVLVNKDRNQTKIKTDGFFLVSKVVELRQKYGISMTLSITIIFSICKLCSVNQLQKHLVLHHFENDEFPECDIVESVMIN